MPAIAFAANKLPNLAPFLPSCDSIEIKDKSAIVEHEATTSKIGEDQLFYCKQRGIDNEKAIGLIVNGYCKEVLNKLPMEFAVEAQKLLAISLEGSVG